MVTKPLPQRLKDSRRNFEKNSELFMRVYNSLYPEKPLLEMPILGKHKLFYYYYNILGWWEILDNGYEVYNEGHQKLPADYFIDYSYGLWLLYDFPIENFQEQLAAFMIMNEKETLLVSDYIILFYSSLQEPEMKVTLEGLPLPVLYDICNPVVEDNVQKWIEA
jgi:hypothetical protein